MNGQSTTRGSLRVYLGAAPGVGKTFAMLNEGHRRTDRGSDVVVGFVETHGRELTRQAIGELEVVPRARLDHRGAQLTEMDVDAVLARKPQIALIDELAHTNVVGCQHEKRWQDVEELLDAGIDVITTVNIQHLESLNDVVYSITGVRQAETVPDEVVRRADQIELVDMSPQALRRRMAHGNIYKSEKVDAALTNYFREGNLTALRELALLWTADRVDQALEVYRTANDIEAPWATRERVVVCLTGGAEGESLLRRGARIAQRAVGGELLALHVSTTDGLASGSPANLTRQRRMVEDLAGSFHLLTGSRIADSILEFARGVNASQIVLGAPRRNRLAALVSEGVGPKVMRESGEIDVHIVTHDRSASGWRPEARPSLLSRRRRAIAWLIAVLGIPLVALVLTQGSRSDALPIALMVFLGAVVMVALLGGMWPALTAAIVSAVLADYLFTEPYQTLKINSPVHVVAVIVLLAVAISAARVVDVSATRLRQAARARAEADTLTVLSGSILRGEPGIPALLDQLLSTFSLSYVALRERAERTQRWRVRESTGIAPQDRAELTEVQINDELELVFSGRALEAEDMRVLTAVAIQADALIERDRLRFEARRVRQEHERTSIRTALLAAVSHDLRTPLASVKAGISSLRSHEQQLTEDDRAELLETVEESADRLQALIDNLLDMSRLDAGVVKPVMGEVWIPDLVPAASRGVEGDHLKLQIPVDLPPVWGDEGLLERALANVVENAVRFSPLGQPVSVIAEAVNDMVVLRVVDTGPGVRERERERIFEPFQRSGDTPRGQGVGLGLAVARGFVEASKGHLDAEDTPGGGLTLIFELPAAKVGP